MKMTQPELGKKIAELRKSKGLTQEELVDRCHLSVRTLQRIESGEVVPRSHTLRVIFEELEYPARISGSAVLNRFMDAMREVFNFKTHTMKKISILTAATAATAVILLLVAPDSRAQSQDDVRQIVESGTRDFVRWFNAGELDSLVSSYRSDACLLTVGCGHKTIRNFYGAQMQLYTFDRMEVLSVSVSDSIAVEKGQWTVRLFSGETLRGEYMTEWRRTGKQWLIVNDISDSY